MKIKTINLSLPAELLDQVDKVAKSEFRNRSELFRELARGYLLRNELSKIRQSLGNQAKKRGYTPGDVNKWIKEYRTEK